MMGTAGTAGGDFRTALHTGSFNVATKAPDRAEPSLEQVKKVADALSSLALTGDLPALREGAERALEDLQRQLRNRPDWD